MQTRLTHFLAQVLFAAVAVAGCAAVTCRPTTITVAKKDQTVRLETGPGPMRTTGTGRLEEEVRPTLVREYWVQSDQGRWLRVSAAQFRTAAIGHPLDICW